MKKAVHEFCYDKCYALAKAAKPKKEREAGFASIKEEFLATIPEEELEEKTPLVERYYHAEEKEAMRNLILDEGIRLDGRVCNEVRPIWCEVNYLPCAHGSAIFTRGETQSLATVTLGTKMDMKETDEVLIQDDQQFVLHYNFPPFATGEAKSQRGVGRREIGHGNLALRALKPVVPLAPENPYAVLVVSDILESNGSSSMASVCGGCLALMDAGVKIKKPVAGVAMGLITDETCPNDRYAILTDILGDEDHLGDMDFKVTGTKDGITATQMDIKVDGLSYDVLEKALEQARQGRLHIMGEMMKTISEPREDYKPFVPRIEQMRVPAEFIGAIIGKGGETIQKIQKETGTTITIDEQLIPVHGQGRGIAHGGEQHAAGLRLAVDFCHGLARPVHVVLEGVVSLDDFEGAGGAQGDSALAVDAGALVGNHQAQLLVILVNLVGALTLAHTAVDAAVLVADNLIGRVEKINSHQALPPSRVKITGWPPRGAQTCFTSGAMRRMAHSSLAT